MLDEQAAVKSPGEYGMDLGRIGRGRVVPCAGECGPWADQRLGKTGGRVGRSVRPRLLSVTPFSAASG